MCLLNLNVEGGLHVHNISTPASVTDMVTDVLYSHVSIFNSKESVHRCFTNVITYLQSIWYTWIEISVLADSFLTSNQS